MLLCTYQHLVYICTILCVLMIILSFVLFCSAIAFTFNYSYHGMHIPSVAQVALQFLQNRVLRYIIFKGSRKFYEECGDEICQWQQKVGLGYGCLGGLLVQTFHSNMVKKIKKSFVPTCYLIGCSCSWWFLALKKLTAVLLLYFGLSADCLDSSLFNGSTATGGLSIN